MRPISRDQITDLILVIKPFHTARSSSAVIGSFSQRWKPVLSFGTVWVFHPQNVSSQKHFGGGKSVRPVGTADSWQLGPSCSTSWGCIVRRLLWTDVLCSGSTPNAWLRIWLAWLFTTLTKNASSKNNQTATLKMKERDQKREYEIQI